MSYIYIVLGKYQAPWKCLLSSSPTLLSGPGQSPRIPWTQHSWCPGIMLVAQPFAEQDLKTSAIVLSTSKKAFSPFLPALNQWVRTLLSPRSASPLTPSP